MGKKTIGLCLLLTCLLCIKGYSATNNAKYIYNKLDKTVVEYSLSRSSLLHNKNINFIQKNNQLKIKLNLKQLQVIHRLDNYIVNFDNIKIDNFSNLKTVGKPSLPFYTFLINQKASNVRVKITKGQSFVVPGEILPSPTLQMPLRNKKPNPFQVIVNQKSFSSQDIQVQIEDLGDYRGQDISRVFVSPIKYKNFSRLTIYPHMEIDIKNKKSLLNARAINVFDFSTRFNFSKRMNFSNKKIIILVPAKFQTSIEQYVHYKQDKGYIVKVVTLEELGNYPQNIKRNLRTIYKSFKFSHALIIGDEKNFPTFYVTTESNNNTPSDFPYFIMGGKNDKIVDSFYSRIVCTTKDELISQLNKIVDYDRNDKNLNRKHILMLASDEGNSPSDVEYSEMIAQPLIDKFGVEEKHVYQKDIGSSKKNILSAFKKGVSWLSYIGHGSGYEWDSIMPENPFDIFDVIGAEYHKESPIIIDVACENGRFAKGYLGEQFMNSSKSSNSPVAYYGGSVDISWNPPAIMSVGISKNIVKYDDITIGESVFLGQMYLLQNYAELNEVYDNFKWYHLFGDSSMKVRLK